MNGSRFGAVVITGLVLVTIGLSAFTVNERELAIKLQVGEVVKSDYAPGLHFKIPIYQTVRKFPKRILTITDKPERIFTAERLALQVDFFVKWRIVDAVQFYTATGGILRVANNRLSEIIKNAIVTEFGKRSVQEAISVERAELMRDMLATAAVASQGLGVELIDIRVKQVEFPDEVRNSVYAQMREERARVAAERRAQGREIAEQRKATADKERTSEVRAMRVPPRSMRTRTTGIPNSMLFIAASRPIGILWASPAIYWCWIRTTSSSVT
jgi:membrane protease subunit HflC